MLTEMFLRKSDSRFYCSLHDMKLEIIMKHVQLLYCKYISKSNHYFNRVGSLNEDLKPVEVPQEIV